MDDSPDIFGDQHRDTGEGEDETSPSAAELEAAGQSALFGGFDEPAAPKVEEPAAETPPWAEEAAAKPVTPSAPPPVAATSSAPAQPYRVLARKYRPQT